MVKSSLSEEQQRKLLSLFGRVRLHLLYKTSVHGLVDGYLARCSKQGPTVVVAYNSSGFVFGAYTSKSYVQCGQDIYDKEAFLYSISPKKDKPIKVTGIPGQPAFTDGNFGPHFGALSFLYGNQPRVHSNPGQWFNINSAAMHGGDMALTDTEVFRVEDLGDLLDKPWRTIQWTAERKQALRKFIQSYRTEIKTVHQARVLLVGQIGSGKSSFFNSLNSIFRGNMTYQANAGIEDGKSVTTQFRSYSIKAGKGGGAIPLILCDTMGLDESADLGIDVDDIISVCKGHVKDRYQFSPAAPLQENSLSYRKHVTLNDLISCVVYVVDTCKVSVLGQKMLDNFAAIRKRTNLLGIRQILLMTKVDEACPLVAKDLKNIYRSVYIQQMARRLSDSLGLPLSNVIPVKNYSDELDLDQDIDILLLGAVEQMLNCSDSFFENLDIDEQQNDQEELYRSSDHPRPAFTERTEQRVV
ncbi:interferon-induced protein 44-like [Betta splendens]|uniref:Interferon-induced protein 44-like n=1 Tax=Betta splendens TaxID=158456 RepID=A0A6P7LNG2_BETSP|nr:interferon-induced protein 44-like [Betta splendens]XP_028995812.1 interferon-induced protein 44-like [Betta splendens]XP_028995813.1 interferon-induced protein 44-like [Betta splendens]